MGFLLDSFFKVFWVREGKTHPSRKGVVYGANRWVSGSLVGTRWRCRLLSLKLVTRFVRTAMILSGLCPKLGFFHQSRSVVLFLFRMYQPKEGLDSIRFPVSRITCISKFPFRKNERNNLASYTTDGRHLNLWNIHKN